MELLNNEKIVKILRILHLYLHELEKKEIEKHLNTLNNSNNKTQENVGISDRLELALYDAQGKLKQKEIR